MNRQKVRIAQVKAYVIKKRCRKEEFTIIDGIGASDEEAIAKLKASLEEEKAGWKQYRLMQPIVYDAIRILYDTYSSIQRPLMPNASDNVTAFELTA